MNICDRNSEFVAVFTPREEGRAGYVLASDEILAAERAFALTDDKTVLVYRIHAKARNNVVLEK